MRKLIIFSLIFVSQMVFAQKAPKCDPINGLKENSADVQKAICDGMLEELRNSGICKETPPVDANLMKKRISSQLDITMAPDRIKYLQQNWNSYIKLNPWAEKFYAERNSYDRDTKSAPVPILDWFADPKFAENAKATEEYKKAFIEKYAAFAEKMDCTPTFKGSSNYIEAHPTIQGFSAEKMGREQREFHLRNMDAAIKDPKNVQAVADRMKQISDESPDKFFICHNKPERDPNGHVPARFSVSERYQPCAGNFKKNFADNKFDVEPIELTKLLATPEADELSNCIKDRLAKGAKVHHVSINSSASALNNTGNRFCPKDYIGISKARVKTARNKILPGLFSKAGADDIDLSKVDVRENASGTNGDGTSGPRCLYQKNGIEGPLKPHYSTKAGKAELDEAKYVKLQVTFEDSSKKINDSIPRYQPMFRCKKIEFKCE